MVAASPVGQFFSGLDGSTSGSFLHPQSIHFRALNPSYWKQLSTCENPAQSGCRGWAVNCCCCIEDKILSSVSPQPGRRGRKGAEKQYFDIQGFFLPLFLFFSFFKGLHPWHMEVSRLGVESELQLSAYATATETQDPSHVCNLHHSSRQGRITDPLSQARDRTHILMDTSQIRNPLSHDRDSFLPLF